MRGTSRDRRRATDSARRLHAAPPRSWRASSSRCRFALRGQRSRPDGRRATRRREPPGRCRRRSGRRRAGRRVRPRAVATMGRPPRGRRRSAACRAESHARASATGASRTILPSSIMITRSAIASARSTRCSESTTAHRACSTCARNASAPSASSCDVGSSSRSSCGSSASAEARQTRCSSPPESSTVRRSARCRGTDLGERSVRPRPDLLRRRRRGSRARMRPRSRPAS